MLGRKFGFGGGSPAQGHPSGAAPFQLHQIVLQPRDENPYALKDNIPFRPSFVTKMFSDNFELAGGRRNRPTDLADTQIEDFRFTGRGVLVRFSKQLAF
jgi:hypothetical protein